MILLRGRLKSLLPPIGVLIIVVATLAALRLGMTDSHGDAIQAVVELSSAEVRLDSDVLSVVSLRLSHYDSIVSTVLEIEDHRQRLLQVLDTPSYKNNPEIQRLAGRYSEQIVQKIDILEQVKGTAAFLRNEVTYIPFAVSQAARHADPATGLQLLDLSQSLMSLRTQPSSEMRRRMEANIARMSEIVGNAEIAALIPHLRSFLLQQEQLDRSLNNYVGLDSEAVLAKLRGQLLDQQARDERRPRLITRLLAGFSALLIAGLGVAGSLLIRARTVAAVEHRYVMRLETERDERRRIAEVLAEKVAQLEQTRDELVQSEKMASLGRMVSGFAHEVNTPVGVAVGAASAIGEAVAAIHELLKSEEVSEEALVAQLDTMGEAANLTLANLRRAAQLVQSFKRTSINQTSDSCRDYVIAEVVGDVVLSLHSMFKRTKIGIIVDCPADLKAHGPAGALGQILTNLLMNSFLHGYDEGQTAGTIRIAVTAASPERLSLRFSDDGTGMSADVAKRIFEPFFTTRRDHGGSGLGLYIVYNLVTTSLGGTVSCQSAPSAGTTFVLHFPAWIDHQVPADQTQDQESVPT